MDAPRRNRPIQLEVTPARALLWIDRFKEWATAASAVGPSKWAIDFERQAAGLRSMVAVDSLRR